MFPPALRVRVARRQSRSEAAVEAVVGREARTSSYRRRSEGMVTGTRFHTIAPDCSVLLLVGCNSESAQKPVRRAHVRARHSRKQMQKL